MTPLNEHSDPSLDFESDRQASQTLPDHLLKSKAPIADSKEITFEGKVIRCGGSEDFIKGSSNDEKGLLASPAVASQELVDEPEIYTVTVRSCIIGIAVAVFGASVAQLFVFKPVSLHVPGLFVELACYIFGVLLAKIPGPLWWNPGPISSKEVTFASIMAISASIDAIAVQMLIAQDLYFDRPVSPLLALATMLSSQLIGFFWAGLLRPLLIYPANAIFPEMLPSVALLRSLAGNSEICKEKVRYFKKVILYISLYEVIPTYIAPALQAVSLWCLTLPKSPIVTQLFGGSRINEGMGLFALTFDWTTLSYYGPLYTPLVAQINQWVAVLCSIFIFMAAYRYDWFGGGLKHGFPFVSYSLLDSNGKIYNTTASIWPNGTENVDAVRQMGLPRIATTVLLGKAFTCMGAAAAFTSAFLYHWRDMKAVISRTGEAASKEDPHRTITKQYRQFPAYAYVIILAISVALALLASQFSRSGLSVGGMLISLLVAGIVSISAGFVLASSGIWLSIIPPIQLLGGVMFSGNALANFWFTTTQAMSVVLGQLFGSILGTFVNYAVAMSILKNERDVLISKNGNGVFSGVHFLSFESQAVSWGIFTQRLYMPGKQYAVVIYCMIIGVFLPLPIYFLHKWKPRLGFKNIDIAVMSKGFSTLTGNLSSGQMMAIMVGVWSQFYMKRYHKRWFHTYNDILNAALMGGTQITILLLVLFFQGGVGWNVKFPNYFLNPSGPVDYCSMDDD
ncbi:hypothetical protein CROQUDRAFT_714146 [Cronartium quercuum f. sp. fusiforme G11]|uniref:Oligopeptide transporter n=1 Tax=Cronartium quercuum f. sp. fusiforme G11 TaxID=708437 RepID=A0A9P6NTH1_9BASI|nr:hypothetical protein CROQUDRAFT_714146 [Cronartium quercuum f. sp. fusiforme G11]